MIAEGGNGLGNSVKAGSNFYCAAREHVVSYDDLGDRYACGLLLFVQPYDPWLKPVLEILYCLHTFARRLCLKGRERIMIGFSLITFPEETVLLAEKRAIDTYIFDVAIQARFPTSWACVAIRFEIFVGPGYDSLGHNLELFPDVGQIIL